MNQNPELMRGLNQPTPQTTPHTTRTGKFFRTQTLGRLQALRGGSLRIDDPIGSFSAGESSGQSGSGSGLSAQVRVHDLAFYKMLALGGSVGAGEAYILGLWDSEDLTAVIRLLVRNMDVLDAMEGGFARLSAPLLAWFHRRHRNSLAGSRRNIAAHYDLGNELFQLFLDPSMMYSSAYFSDSRMTLEQAQEEKLDRICAALQLSSSDRVIEIGSGWGGFAIHAAREYGAHVTTTTISRRQYDLALERIREAGLEHRIDLRLQDYRELDGQYDKGVSIEMIEAIGADNMPGYFERCMQLLHPEGQFLLQAITIEDHRYQRALNSVDFIKRYVFPGSFIPSVSAIMQDLSQHSDFGLLRQEDFGQSYALTVREWRKRFSQRLDQVRKLGYPEQFIRLWIFYLCYCEGGFMERSIGVSQMLLARPAFRAHSET